MELHCLLPSLSVFLIFSSLIHFHMLDQPDLNILSVSGGAAESSGTTVK